MSNRLNKEDWLKHGLKILAQKGFGALKAEPLAKGLGVSRGSFYWHFKDIDFYHEEILSHWEDITTQKVIDDVSGHGDKSTRLNSLLQSAFRFDTKLEREVRAWAAHNEKAAKAIQKVDAKRISYIAELLGAAGVSNTQIRTRAVFLNFAYLGQISAISSDLTTLQPQEISDLASLFQS